MPESGWVHELLNWISTHSAWAGLIVFLIALVESLILVGILIPGIMILLGIGALIALGALDFYTVWFAASAGAFAGDLISYLLGHKYRERLTEMWPFRNYPKMLGQARYFIYKHGNKSIVLGRFIGPLRPVVPAVAGMLGMTPQRFLKIDIPACIAWAPAYLLPGMLFGASLEVASEYTGRLAMVLIVIALVIGLSVWLFRLLYDTIVRLSMRNLRRLIRWSRRHPLLGRPVSALLDPSKPEALSLAMLGLSLITTITLLLVLLLLIPWGDQPLRLDQGVADLAAALRSEMVDPLMITLYQLGRWPVLLFTAGVTLAWLLLQKRYKAAGHWLLAIVGGSILQLILTAILTAAPEATGLTLDASAPSSEFVLATTALGFFAVMESADLRRIHRRWPYILASLALILLAISRLYLGQDQLSTLTLGFLLGGSWTAIVGFAYRQRIRRVYKPIYASLVFFSGLIIAVAYAANQQLQSETILYELEYKKQVSSAPLWWQQDWQRLDSQRARVGSHAARDFNLQFAGSAAKLREQLLQSGWRDSTSPGWLWPLKTLNPQADAESLPIPGRDYLGHKETLRLLLHDDNSSSGQQRVIALRIWPSGMMLNDSQQSVYLGQIIAENLHPALGLFHYWRAQALSREELEEIHRGLERTGLEFQNLGVVTLLRQQAIERQ
ncbi:MAG: VTT domain-containing protein [Xanthomonadales bacterium]|nr:VTT domain-containing protein [Xanthomonadales bacterium]